MLDALEAQHYNAKAQGMTCRAAANPWQGDMRGQAPPHAAQGPPVACAINAGCYPGPQTHFQRGTWNIEPAQPASRQGGPWGTTQQAAAQPGLIRPAMNGPGRIEQPGAGISPTARNPHLPTPEIMELPGAGFNHDLSNTEYTLRLE
jgi:hypothetical protein